MVSLVRRAAAVLEAPLTLLDRQRSAAAIAVALMPVMMILLFPAGFGENESQYFMLALRKLAPDGFSAYSAAFDASNARLLSQLLIGVPVYFLGFDVAQIALRCLMMLVYAVSLAYMLSALRLSALQAIVVIGAYLMLGPDLMGAEWLFEGVEPKTFAYACVFLSFGFAFRDRPLAAAASMALATGFHFLVGGFWFMALLLLMAIRTDGVGALWKPFALYAIAILPVVGLVVDDQLISSAARPPDGSPAADYLFAIVRVPHHATPFANSYQLGFWMQGIIATLGLFCAFVLLAPQTQPPLRKLIHWLILLLGYLLLAVALSWFDQRSGAFGKFLPFRPSALILLFSVIAFVLALRTDAVAEPGRRNVILKAAFVAMVPVCLWANAKDSVKWFALGRGYNELPQVLAFLQANASPQDVILTDPNSDMQPIGADLPRLIQNPTLVSFKYVPQTPKDIYRWWSLLEFRNGVYAGACPGPNDPPVRYLLYVDRPETETPRCGREIFRSAHFMIAELPPFPAR
jgi:hypothetical protein